MIPSTMIDLALELSHSNLKQMGDGDESKGTTRMYLYLNIAKDRFWNAYCHAREGSTFDVEFWNANLTQGQTEYVLPDVVSNTHGVKKINSVAISYGASSYTDTAKLMYKRAEKVDPNNLPHDWFFYEQHQSIDNPIYFVSAKSIFIAPSPRSSVTNGIKLEGVRKIKDYTNLTSQTETIIPEEFHHVVVQGVLPYIYRKQGKVQQANAEMSEYERQEKEALIELSNFNNGPFFATYPDERKGTYNII